MNGTKTISNSPAARKPAVGKRVILSMGGKGGVGKTSVMAGLAEWFQENSIPVKLLDLDTENKSRGSLTHFFGGQVPNSPCQNPLFCGTIVSANLTTVADEIKARGEISFGAPYMAR